MENSTEETRTESANCTLTSEEAEHSDERQSPAPTGTQTTHTGRNLSVYLSIDPLLVLSIYSSIHPSFYLLFILSFYHPSVVILYIT